jgi:hypothetical protein
MSSQHPSTSSHVPQPRSDVEEQAEQDQAIAFACIRLRFLVIISTSSRHPKSNGGPLMKLFSF